MTAFKEWVGTLREDVETLKRVVACADVNPEARRYAAAGLNYLVTRMDLVPDWEETVGVLDDVFVMRVLIRLAMQHQVDEGLDSQTLVEVGRLANEAETVEAYLGSELYARLRKHCAALVDQAVRERTPAEIVGERATREALFREVADEIKRLPAAAFSDPDAVAVKLKSYLQHKLGK